MTTDEPIEALLAKLANRDDYVKGPQETAGAFRSRVLCGLEQAAQRAKWRSTAMTVAQLVAELARLMASHPEIGDRPVAIPDCGKCGCGYPSYLDADAVAAICGLDRPATDMQSRPAALHVGACESPTNEIVYNDCKISRADAEAMMAELRTNPPPPTQIIELGQQAVDVAILLEAFDVLAYEVAMGEVVQPTRPDGTPASDGLLAALKLAALQILAYETPSAETTVEAVMDEMRATQQCGSPAPRVLISGGTAPRTSTITED